MYKKISMIILNSAIALTVIYLVVVIVIFLSQRKLMYHPNENNYLEENQLNPVSYTHLTLPTTHDV